MTVNELPIYSRSKNNIWTDPYISKNMLKAHLDYEHDGASRNIRTINKTVDWIDSIAENKKKMLDLGCGPGLYAFAFAGKGYSVTGIDISSSSIEYAKKQIKLENRNIEFICADYLEKRVDSKYDIVTCIYCDFGALIPREQKAFLKNVHTTVNNNGIIILDVFGKGICRGKKEYRKWEYIENKDFWSPKPHYLLEESIHYKEQKVWGNRTIVIEEKAEPKEYITWDHYYTEEEITELLKENRFRVTEIKRNIVSKNDFTSNDVLFIKARKI